MKEENSLNSFTENQDEADFNQEFDENYEKTSKLLEEFLKEKEDHSFDNIIKIFNSWKIILIFLIVVLFGDLFLFFPKKVSLPIYIIIILPFIPTILSYVAYLEDMKKDPGKWQHFAIVKFKDWKKEGFKCINCESFFNKCYEEYTQLIDEIVNQNKTKKKYVNLFSKIFCLFLLPFLYSIIILSQFNHLTLIQFSIFNLIILFGSLVIAYIIVSHYTSLPFRKIDNMFVLDKITMVFILIIILIALVLLFLMYKNIDFNIFLSLLKNITYGTNKSINNVFLTSSLSLVLVSATLSLLAFTYGLVLENKDENSKSDKKLNIIKSGEEYFKATILAILFLFITFLSSAYLNLFYFILSDFDIIVTWNNFLFAYLLFGLFIGMLLTFLYALVYLYKGLNHSFKSLKINWLFN